METQRIIKWILNTTVGFAKIADHFNLRGDDRAKFKEVAQRLRDEQRAGRRANE